MEENITTFYCFECLPTKIWLEQYSNFDIKGITLTNGIARINYLVIINAILNLVFDTLVNCCWLFCFVLSVALVIR